MCEDAVDSRTVKEADMTAPPPRTLATYMFP